MRLAENFARLAGELSESPSGLFSEISVFPSGALSMRVHLGSRLFDFDYFPSRSLFCVDELEPDAAFDSGYRYGFQDFDSAKAKLLGLLEEAQAAATEDRKPPLADAKATTR
ncbi:MAG TPA: hypothetical protein VF306_10845 [Pirellulales bacterium]